MLLIKFGNRLKDIRDRIGVSQQKLSEKSGIMREQISRIENGQINPTLETISRLSVALEVKMSELVDIPLENELKIKKYKIKPFVKWAGGKTQIIEKLKEFLPNEFNTYYEPFVGGGALFFNLLPEKAVISDYNEELIMSYNCFKDLNNFSRMIEELKIHEQNHNEEYYLKVRDIDRLDSFKEMEVYEKAARMIYLNKACFNGLYRVNSKGYFNVPSGKKEKVNAYNQELFDEIHEFLSTSNIKILNGDFEKVTNTAKQDDFVYFDPPYDTYDEKNGFTTYTKDDFGKDEQKRLSDIFKKLDKKGVKVMLSNHNTKFIQDLYEGYNIHVIQAKRMINSKAAGRGSVEEVIITNY